MCRKLLLFLIDIFHYWLVATKERTWISLLIVRKKKKSRLIRQSVKPFVRRKNCVNKFLKSNRYTSNLAYLMGKYSLFFFFFAIFFGNKTEIFIICFGTMRCGFSAFAPRSANKYKKRIGKMINNFNYTLSWTVREHMRFVCSGRYSWSLKCVYFDLRGKLSCLLYCNFIIIALVSLDVTFDYYFFFFLILIDSSWRVLILEQSYCRFFFSVIDFGNGPISRSGRNNTRICGAS